MRIRLISTLFFTFLYINYLSAQVWTLDDREIYVNLSYSSFLYNQKHDSTGELVSLPVEVTDRTIQLFVQYGITDKFTAQLKVPYKILNTTGDLALFNSYGGNYLEAGKLNYTGNIEAGVIYKFIEDKPIVSASFFVETNTSNHNYITGLQSGFNSWGFKPGAGVGWSFPESWMSFYLGGDIRTNNYSSSVLSELELGYKPVSYIYIAGNLNVKRSLDNGNGDCDCTSEYTALYLNDQEYFSYGIKGGFNIKEWGFNLGYSSAFSANNLPVRGIPTIGVQYKSLVMRNSK